MTPLQFASNAVAFGAGEGDGRIQYPYQAGLVAPERQRAAASGLAGAAAGGDDPFRRAARGACLPERARIFGADRHLAAGTTRGVPDALRQGIGRKPAQGGYTRRAPTPVEPSRPRSACLAVRGPAEPQIPD